MRKTLFLLAAALAFQSFCPPVRAGYDTAPTANFILIGWDGAQRAHVEEMLGAGKLPNLANLIKEGCLVETSVVTGPTQTKPGWSEILTGYSSRRLKILSNKEYRPIPKGYTVFERLKTRFGGAITVIFITAKPYNLGARGPHEICDNAYTRDPVTMVQRYYLDRARFKGTTRDGKPPRWVRREGEPYFNAVNAVDEHIGSDSDAETTGKTALAVLEKYRKKPFFVFVHFREPDEQGHQYGENSPEYEIALSSADRQLGEIVGKLKQLGLYSKTAVFVTSDHGMDEGKQVHRNAPFMFLAANRALGRSSGDRKDVTPTILDWYGFDLGKISPRLDGSSLLSPRVPARAAEPEKRTVKLGYFIGGRTTLFGRAFADACFDREGVKVELITRWLRGDLMKVPESLKEVAALEKDHTFGKMTGTEIVDMIARGELDGGLIGDGAFQEAAHSGKPIVAVALLGHDKKDAPGHGIVLRKGLVVRKPADFAGLKLITRRAGPGDLIFLKEFLRQEGIPEKSVTITDQVDDDRIQSMLTTGKADGGYMHLGGIYTLVRKKAVYVYRPINWVNPEISLALLVFRRDFIQSHRDLVLKIATGYMKRIAYERSIPANQREKNKKGKGGKTALMELDFPDMNLPVYDYPPKVRLELLDEMQKLMVTHGLLKGTTDLGVFVDTGIVESAWQNQISSGPPQ